MQRSHIYSVIHSLGLVQSKQHAMHSKPCNIIQFACSHAVLMAGRVVAGPPVLPPLLQAVPRHQGHTEEHQAQQPRLSPCARGSSQAGITGKIMQ